VSLPLPAHRFEERKDLADHGGPGARTWAFDFDETITRSPRRMARLAIALKAIGDEVVIITGNDSKRTELEDRLENDYGFPWDQLIQYSDEDSHGDQREAILKELGAWCAFDDRMARAPILTEACPHLFLSVKGNKEDPKGDLDDPEDVVEENQ
jgi:hypothetical protein